MPPEVVREQRELAVTINSDSDDRSVRARRMLALAASNVMPLR